MDEPCDKFVSVLGWCLFVCSCYGNGTRMFLYLLSVTFFKLNIVLKVLMFKIFILSYNIMTILKILRAETSPIFHVTMTVVVRSKSYQ